MIDVTQLSTNQDSFSSLLVRNARKKEPGMLWNMHFATEREMNYFDTPASLCVKPALGLSLAPICVEFRVTGGPDLP